MNPIEIINNYLNNWQSRNSLDIDFDVAISANPTFGDYTTNIAMVSVKKVKGFNNPRLLAEKIVEFLNESDDIKDVFKKIEVAGAGFINFYLADKYLLDSLKSINSEKDTYGHSDVLKNMRTIVEFGDPNPFKQIHIGHLRNFCIGESFSRLLEANGSGVVRANYQGDVGMHVAKALFGIRHKIQNEQLSINSLTADILAQAYTYGATEFEKSDEAKEEIKRLNKLVYAEDNEVKELWEKGRGVSLADFEKLYKKIGIKYEKYYFESVTAKRGREIVLENLGKVFEKDDGAIIYRGEQDGLHTRVFLTSEDYATYEGKDLALAVMKEDDLEPDRSIVLTGNEQAEYFQVMLAALRRIKPEIAEKTEHYTFGHVRLKEGKMSSRTGDVITSEWLLSEAIKKIKENFSEIDNDTSEKIGIGAVKYSMLKYGINSDIHFDFAESISLDGNSGPYLQYAYVRTQSVLSRIKNQELRIKNIEKLEKEEDDLLRFLTQFPYMVEKAAVDFAPNVICTYLFELSQKFNLFYQKQKIIGSDNEVFRIELTKATGQVIKNGLNLLGIETVARM